MVVPNMSDGRAFTDYRQNCQMMHDFRKDTGITDPKSVRLFMQQEADKIMSTNQSGRNCGRFEANGKTAMCTFSGDSLSAGELMLPAAQEKMPNFTPAPLETMDVRQAVTNKPSQMRQARPTTKPVQQQQKPMQTVTPSPLLGTATPSPANFEAPDSFLMPTMKPTQIRNSVSTPSPQGTPLQTSVPQNTPSQTPGLDMGNYATVTPSVQSTGAPISQPQNQATVTPLIQ